MTYHHEYLSSFFRSRTRLPLHSEVNEKPSQLSTVSAVDSQMLIVGFEYRLKKSFKKQKDYASNYTFDSFATYFHLALRVYWTWVFSKKQNSHYSYYHQQHLLPSVVMSSFYHLLRCNQRAISCGCLFCEEVSNNSISTEQQQRNLSHTSNKHFPLSALAIIKNQFTNLQSIIRIYVRQNQSNHFGNAYYL